MKETTYKCDECNEKVAEGCVGTSSEEFFDSSFITLKKVVLHFDVKNLEVPYKLFCSLTCFSKYYAKKRLHEAEVKYA